MGGGECVGGLAHDPAGLLHRQAAAPLEPSADRFAVHVSHHEVDQPLALADRVDGDDVGMGEAGRGLGLAGEALADLLLECELRREDLDGDPTLQPIVGCTVHHAHAAAPDFTLDGVRVAEGVRESSGKRLVVGFGHRPRCAGCWESGIWGNMGLGGRVDGWMAGRLDGWTARRRAGSMAWRNCAPAPFVALSEEKGAGGRWVSGIVRARESPHHR